MLINKNKVYVNNNKKVLHKVGKKWVTVSTLLLALLGGTAVASKVSAHADNTQQSTQQSAQYSVQPTSTQKSLGQPSQSTVISPKNNMKVIGQQANQMHQNLQQNAVQQEIQQRGARQIQQQLDAEKAAQSKKFNNQSVQPSNRSGNTDAKSVIASNSASNPSINTTVHGKSSTKPSSPEANNTTNNNDNAKQSTNVSRRTLPKGKLGGSTQSDIYRGLNYSVNGNSVTFTNGSLVNSDGYQFINSTTPAAIKNASNITFGTGVDTSQLSDMSEMFESDNNLTSLDLSGMNTQNVTNMKSAFANDKNLQYLDLGNQFYTSKAAANNNGTDRLLMSDSSLSHLHTGQQINFAPTGINSMWYQVGTNYQPDNSIYSPEVNLTNGNSYSGWLDWYGDTSGKWGSANYSLDTSTGIFTVSDGTPNGPLNQLNSDVDLDDISKIQFTNTASLPSNAQDLFYETPGMGSVVDIDLSQMSPSPVTNLNNMFANLPNLRSIEGLNNITTNGATTMINTFGNDPRLISLDNSSDNLIPWNTSDVSDMGTMFQGDSDLPTLDLHTFDTRNLTAAPSMFYGDGYLTKLNFVLNGSKSPYVPSIFSYTTHLTNNDAAQSDGLLLQDFYGKPTVTPNWNGSGNSYKDSNDWGMFYASGLAQPNSILWLQNAIPSSDAGLSLNGWTNINNGLNLGNTPSSGKYTNKSNSYAFPVHGEFWGTAPFSYQNGVLTVTGPGTLDDLFDDGNVNGTIGDSPVNEIDINHSDVKMPVDSSDLFADEPNLLKITGLNNLDDTNVTNAHGLFAGTRLSDIDLSQLPLPKVTNMSNMFELDSNLKTIKIPQNFGQNASDMSHMFSDDSALQHLNVQNMSTQSAKNLDSMFQNDYSLITLILGNNFKISNQNGMNISDMFSNDKNLVLLDLGNANDSLDTSTGLLYPNEWYSAQSPNSSGPATQQITANNHQSAFDEGQYNPSDDGKVNIQSGKPGTDTYGGPFIIDSGNPFDYIWVRGDKANINQSSRDTIIYYVTNVPAGYSGKTGNLKSVVMTGPSNSSFTVGTNPDGLPQGYYVLSPKDSIQYDGKTHHINVAPNNYTVTFDFYDNNGTLIKQKSYNGYPGQKISTSFQDIPSGYTVAPTSNYPSSFTIDYNNGTVPVNLQPAQATFTVQFINSDNQPIGQSYQVTGNVNSDYSLSPSDGHVPQEYRLSSPVSISYGKENGKTIPIMLNSTTHKDNVIFTYNGNEVGSDWVTMNGNNDYLLEGTDSHIPAGYTIDEPVPVSVPYNKSSISVPVSPTQRLDVVTYMYGNKPVGTHTFSGTGKTSDSYTITPSDTQVLPSDYMISTPVTVPYNQSSDTIDVQPRTASDVVTFYLKGTNQKLGTRTFVGLPGGYYDLTPANSSSVLPPGYRLQSDVTDEQILYSQPTSRINLEPIQTTASEHIIYTYNGRPVASRTINGNINSTSGVSGANVNHGWHIVGNPTVTIHNGSDKIPVEPAQNTVILKFVNQHGQQIGSPVQKQGNSASDTGVGDTAYVVQPNDTLIPLGYELPNNKPQSAAYDGKVHVINIIGKLHAPTSNTGVQPDKIMFDNPKDRNNRDNTVAVTYHLVTPGVSDSTHTAYINVSGRTGDTTSLSPQLYSPNGYKVTPSDTNANILFTPTGITPNNVTWTFEGKAKKLPQPKPKSHKQKPAPKPTPTPKPIPKKHTVKPRVVVHPHKVVIPQHQQVMPPKPKQIHVYPRTTKHELPQTGEVHHTNVLLDASLMLLASISLAGVDMLRKRKDI